MYFLLRPIITGLGVAVLFAGMCFAQSAPLPYHPVGAAYSYALDRIIMIEATPPRLHIYDPVSQSDVSVGLPKVPNVLSVSPDGLHAAVGHDALLSLVNLQTATLEKTVVLTFNVKSLSLDATYAYLINNGGTSGNGGAISWVNLATGAIAGGTGSFNATYLDLSPSGKTLYGSGSTAGARVKFDVSTGPITAQTAPPQGAANSICGNSIFSQDGKLLYGLCGPVLRISDDPNVDLSYVTNLPNTPSRIGITESATLKRLAVILTNNFDPNRTQSDGQIGLFDTSYFQPKGRILLSPVVIAGQSYTPHGKWIFFNSAGTTLYVVTEADSSANVQNDFNVQSISLGSPTSCVATFGTAAARSSAAGGVATISIGATPDCLYQASTTAPWITLVSGDYGSGPGTLSYVVQRNAAASARTGTIALGSQILTITQDGATSSASAFSRLAYHIVDAAYSRALDRVISVSTGPNELHIYDPLTKADQAVALIGAPAALSVRPDGYYAAVAHDGYVSYVNLQTAAVETIFPTSTNLQTLLLASNGYIYGLSQGTFTGLLSLELATGKVSILSNFQGSGTTLRLRADLKLLLLFNPGVFQTADISQGVATLLSTPTFAVSNCTNEWLSETGGILYTSCGNTYTTSGTTPLQFVYSGALSNASSLRWADDSAIQQSVAVIPGYPFNNNDPTDTEVQVYGDQFLGLSGRITLPSFASGNTTFSGHGRFVFWNRTGTKLIVLEAADSNANLVSDYGVFVISPGDASSGCTFSLTPSAQTYGVSAGFDSVTVNTGSTCAWTATSSAAWLNVTAGSFGIGAGSANFSVAANTGAARTATITIAGQTFTAIQAGTDGTVTLVPTTGSVPAAGGSGSVAVTASAPTFAWTAQSTAPWLTITSGASGTGNGQVTYLAAVNTTTSARTGVLSIGGSSVQITQQGAPPPVGLRFTAVAPCRIADTRTGSGKTGAFGAPGLAANTSRDFPVPASSCGLPATAQAYALNVTVVPDEPLNYLTLWPTGQAQPFVSTLNSFDGRIVADAAIVPAGTNGAVSVYVTNRTNVIIDVTGYFDSQNPQGLSFYASTPCRVADTRGNAGPFGGPMLTAGSSRDFAVPNSACGIPNTAQAYSTNVTVVPAEPLYFLTAWPTGQPQPLVSTLNSFDGSVVANAAIIPAGTNGAVSIGVTNRADVILDSNGYFAPPGAAKALQFYPLPPCRVVDTRGQGGITGAFGPPSIAGNSTRDFPLAGSCGIPATAQAYSLNVTVVPAGPLAFLSLWPSGQAQPQVSTLNSFAGKVVSNAAIVPSGTNGAISVFSSDATDVILDVNGYFAP